MELTVNKQMGIELSNLKDPIYITTSKARYMLRVDNGDLEIVNMETAETVSKTKETKEKTSGHTDETLERYLLHGCGPLYTKSEFCDG